MLDKKITDYIDKVAREYNTDAKHHCEQVSLIIKKLNDYIDGNMELGNDEIEGLLDELVGYYTITLNFSLSKDINIVRAVKYEETNLEKPCHPKVSRLSYIPNNLSHKSKIGRLNKKGDVIFYGCLSNNDDGISVAFSEINIQEDEYVNILKSKLKNELMVRYVGVFDYYKRGVEPPFKIHPNFKITYEYQRDKFNNYLMVAYQLCDAFFSDILRRKGNDRLYQVTSILASLFLDGNGTDALIYSSVQSEGAAVLAIKPCKVDEKLEHINALSMYIEKNYGYSIYEAPTLYNGAIKGDDIEWRKC